MGDSSVATPHVVVVGSVNVDISVTVDRLPSPGETLLAATSRRSGGGKGANQAVGSARAGGARTTLVAAVGADADGDALVSSLTEAGVDTAAVQRLSGVGTGIALITVDRRGENTIVVAAGANGHLRLRDADRAAITGADAVLAQLEVPQPVLVEAARARRAGAPFVLNAAPSASLLPELAHQVDILVVNEHEARDLAGRAGAGGRPVESDADAFGALQSAFGCVVLTLGPAGASLARRGGEPVHVAAPEVVATDTVAAGDTFCGVLVAELARGASDREALQLACAAASLAVQRAGAQDSVPTAEETRAQARASYAEPPTPGRRWSAPA